MWGRTRHWFGWRKERIAQQKTIDGVLEYASGHYLQAEQLSVNHVQHSKRPLLNYLTAINAAQSQGKLVKRDEYLAQALAFDDSNATLLAIKLRLMVETNDIKAANSWLETQADSIKLHDDILALHFDIKYQMHEWESAISLCDRLLKRKLITVNEYESKICTVYIKQLTTSSAGGVEQVQRIYKLIPRKYRNHIDIFCEYAKLSIKFEQSTLVEKELFQRLAKNYDSKLLVVVLTCSTKNAKLWVEKLVSLNKYQDIDVFIDAITYLYQLDRQWKSSKEWILKAIEFSPNSQRFETLAIIQQELGESSGALDSFNNALKYRPVK